MTKDEAVSCLGLLGVFVGIFIFATAFLSCVVWVSNNICCGIQ